MEVFVTGKKEIEMKSLHKFLSKINLYIINVVAHTLEVT